VTGTLKENCTTGRNHGNYARYAKKRGGNNLKLEKDEFVRLCMEYRAKKRRRHEYDVDCFKASVISKEKKRARKRRAS
jgi:hypothetical protein